MSAARRTDRRLRLLRVAALWCVLDVAGATAGALAAYVLRFHGPLASLVPVTKGVPPLHTYVLGGLALGLLWALVFRADGLYDVRRFAPRAVDAARLARGSLLGTALAGAVSFFYRGASFSRLVLPLTWVLGLAAVLALRAIAQAALRRAIREPWTRIVVAGEGPLADRLAAALARATPVGHAFSGVVGARPASLGPLRDLEEIVDRHGVNHVILALPRAADPGVLTAAARLHARGVEVEFVPEVADLLPAQPVVTSLAGVPLIGLRESPLAGWRIVLKRGVDVAAAAALLVALAPLLALIALAVRLDSPGHVLYRQERIGRDLRRFTLLKFRTMRVDAEPDGPRHAVRADPRRTRVGRVLRRFSLDELPQLWNVLRGDMSLVGPRPERPAFVGEFDASIPGYFLRHRVKSGLTGWAQVHDLRGDAPFDVRTLYDLYYVENWSLALDARIVLRTVGAVLGSRHAV